MIKLRTLGECSIELGAESLAPDSDALFAALLYLSVERGRHVPRALIAELLWPQLSRDRGRHALRQLMYRARRLGAGVEGDRESIVLPESAVAPTFSAAPSAERLVAERLAGSHTIGPFLPGYTPQHSAPFAEWLDRTRAAVESRVRRVILEVARAHRVRGEWGEVDGLSRDCLRIDPLNQEATMLLAEATAMIGDKRHSLAILDRYNEDIGSAHPELSLPVTVLRRRIAERFPNRRYAGPADRCFVGRAPLVQLLSTALLRARNAEGDAILLTGAAGIGKTRLVHELTKHATLHGARVVSVAVEEVDADRPMSAFVDAVPQLRALPGAIGASEESLSFLTRLTDPAAISAQVVELSEPRWVAARIRQAIVDVVEAVTAEGTILLVIEDVHWLDAASWATINALLDGVLTRRLLLLLTSRGPHPTPRTPQRCIERLQVHAVSTLDTGSSLSLVREIVADHGGTIDEDAVHWCAEVGEGNPLFLRELAVHCLEGGAIRAIPPSLQGLLDARIVRLQPTSRHVLQAAAMLGEHATVERLDRMLALPPYEMVGALEELGAQFLIDANTLAVSSRHSLITARALETMPRAARSWLHQSAAIALSNLQQLTPSTDIALACATHWIAVGETERAITALANASADLQRIGAANDAIRLLEAALELKPERSHRIEVLRTLARALAHDGQWACARTVTVEIASLRGSESDPNLEAVDVLLEIDAAYRCGEQQSPILDRICDALDKRALDSTHRIELARRGIVVLTNLGSHISRDRIWNSVDSLIDESDAHPGMRLELQAMREAMLGSVHQSLHYADLLLTMALRQDISARRLRWIVTAAGAYRLAGSIDRSIEINHIVYADSLRLGGLGDRIRSAQILVECYTDVGELAEAKYWLAQARALTADDHNIWHLQSILETQARIALLEGRLDDAAALALECAAHVTSAAAPLPSHQCDAVTLKIEIALVADTAPIEPSLIDELERLHLLLRDGPLHDRAAGILALALQRAGRQVYADELISEYLSKHRRAISDWGDPAELLARYRSR